MGCGGSKEKNEPKEEVDADGLTAAERTAINRRLENRTNSITNADVMTELEDAKVKRMSTKELRDLETRTNSLAPDELKKQLDQANLGHLATEK